MYVYIYKYIYIFVCFFIDYSDQKFFKIICPAIFFMKMAFQRRSCTIVINIIAELKPAFKNRRKHVIQCFINLKPKPNINLKSDH